MTCLDALSENPGISVKVGILEVDGGYVNRLATDAGSYLNEIDDFLGDLNRSGKG
jgi:hypothetical protein